MNHSHDRTPTIVFVMRCSWYMGLDCGSYDGATKFFSRLHYRWSNRFPEIETKPATQASTLKLPLSFSSARSFRIVRRSASLIEVSSKFCKRFMSLLSTEEETWFIGHSADQFPPHIHNCISHSSAETDCRMYRIAHSSVLFFHPLTPKANPMQALNAQKNCGSSLTATEEERWSWPIPTPSSNLRADSSS
jgi:hypothetical protein